MKNDTFDKLAALFILAVCFILYANTLFNGFIFDDLHSIKENIYIKDIRSLPQILQGYYTSTPHVERGMYRPLLLVTFMANYAASGLDPSGYRVINILLHFINGLLFYLLLNFLLAGIYPRPGPASDHALTNPGGIRWPLLALSFALLFCVHPLNSEAVGYITCRSDLLTLMFMLLGLLSYLRGSIFLPCLFYAAALLCKETAMVFVMLSAAIDLTVVSLSAQNRKRRWLFYALILLITAAYLLARNVILGAAAHSGNVLSSPAGFPEKSMLANVLTQAYITLYYLVLFVWPHDLSIHHAVRPILSLSDPRGFFSLLAIVTGLGYAFFARKKRPLVALGIFWYFVCLSPKFYALLNIPAAEHHFYMAGLGVFICLAALSVPLAAHGWRKPALIMAGMILLLSTLTFFRNFEWRNASSLWKSAVKADRNSVIAHHNLALEYIGMGQYEDAEQELNIAARLAYGGQKLERTVLEGYAMLYHRQKKYGLALRYINESLAQKPYDPLSLQNKGVVYRDMGLKQEAKEVWLEALKYWPQSPGINVNLGYVYFEDNDLERALMHFKRAAESDPESDLALMGLGEVYYKQNLPQLAKKNYLAVIRVNPGNIYARFNLSEIYRQEGNAPEELRQLQEIVKTAPSFAQAYNNIAVIYAMENPPLMEKSRVNALKALSLGYPVKKDFLKFIGLEK